MFEMLIKLIFWLINTMYGIIFNPIINFLTENFPTIDDLVSNIQYFLITYIFPTLKWTKMFLMNCTGFPQALFELLIAIFILMVGIHVFLTTFEFALRVYNHFKP